jgi:hypothetical protein
VSDRHYYCTYLNFFLLLYIGSAVRIISAACSSELVLPLQQLLLLHVMLPSVRAVVEHQPRWVLAQLKS